MGNDGICNALCDNDACLNDGADCEKTEVTTPGGASCPADQIELVCSADHVYVQTVCNGKKENKDDCTDYKCQGGSGQAACVHNP